MLNSFVTTLFIPQEAHPSKDHIEYLCKAFIQLLNSTYSSVTSVYHVLSDSTILSVAEIVISTATSMNLAEIRQNLQIRDFEQKHHIQLTFQKNHVYRRFKRLAVFDMDSTLIQQEVVDEIARKLGVEDKVAAITARAMNGELDFTASLRERVALLRGTPITIFEELKQVITLSPGAADLVKALKKLGYKTAVLSGGFKPLTPWLAQLLDLDYAYANTLILSEDGQSLTGEVTGDIIHAEKKRDLVLEIAKTNGLCLDQVLVIGDGANDLPMMSVAGLGIAFNAKPRVQLAAPVRLNTPTLLDVLYLLGISEKERKDLLCERA
jgi:phosphoserine phosphatase